MQAIYDYIVVGAGSAGCAVAARLAQDKQTSVLLLEAGPADKNIWIHIPIGYGKTMFNPQLNWQFKSEPEPFLNNRQIYQPRGRTLGGSSSINGLVYIRGQSQDFDKWEALGNEGWSWRDVLPYFKRSEGNERGESALHGGSGPLSVSNIRGKHELVEAFIGAANEIDVPRTTDFNGAVQEGAGYFQLTTRNGLRCSAAKAYLRSGLTGDNLEVQTDAHAMAVLFDGNKRAIGVRYRQGGQVKEARVNHEVILSSGALQTPQLLMLSGVGDAVALRDKGIKVVHDLPAVGKNLQDHLQSRLIYKCTKPITTNDDLRSWWGQARIGLRWIFRKAGPVAAGIQLGGMFARTSNEVNTPDVQFHFGTISADMTAGKPHDFSGFTMSVCNLRPTSRGELSLHSADPFAGPKATFNYLSTEHDEKTMIAGVRMARRIARSRSLSPYVADEYRPGFDIDSDDEVLDFIREYATTIFHPVGTCRMGPDEASVVDTRLRVRGVRGLRVADASIMPLLLSGNTNAGAIVIGEKAADLIKQDRGQENGRHISLTTMNSELTGELQ
ncbi:choline dehydrogenase [Caballeronia arvi]|uniref:Choline dehydrogenase n=1 Tax=Caballeronia arvi TaxID=1777135 RepID=A0A158L274_9BURK|nr:choline dehydrogenase [Caballeronia arvi]SAL87498.1 choline dehydrogenase [Caballeronia arvi]